MGLFSGLAKVILSPINGVAQIARDLQDDDDAGLAIGTLGISSFIKGTARGIEQGADEIMDDED